MTPAISIRNLKKSYEDTVALKGIDMTIGDGEFFGLLGPNGAGKTTTINILTGLVRKNEGNTEIFGKDTVKDYRFTRSQVGISAQEFTQDWFFPLDKLLYFQAGYYGIPKAKAKDRVDELLSRLGLEEKRESRLRQLSGGMKRRFQIAKALVHDPRILILDEPTAGVDVELRHELWQYFRELHQAGKTILLTTHYIEEAEMLCENVTIIDKGRVITEGSPKALTNQLGKAGITINVTDTEADIESCLKDFTYTREDGRLHFTTQDPEEAMPEIINVLTRQGCHIQRVETTKSSLEDVFLSLTGKGINE
ncbi:MAG: ABC transporter ATP-binding protein [Candidatus Marinimicrobia bacterium]|jgi:ABC-2 type transport system ATP-binding protein|nr:ABC transporter ATP-binding protein [Candidatus Neomarinimicrobiota bacterium]|tara:strand:+ start:9175 stop:10098 length:924 start_codon:yes stop_codon:yes gene_type:complete